MERHDFRYVTITLLSGLLSLASIWLLHSVVPADASTGAVHAGVAALSSAPAVISLRRGEELDRPGASRE
jgi:hypothetical protein